MTLLCRLCLLVLLLQPVATYALSEDQKARIIQEFITSIEPEFANMQGGAIAILSRDKVVYQKTFGFRKGKTDPITLHTLFPLASVSKAVTGAAIGLLAERGKVDLEAKHKLPHVALSVSLKDIVSHTTGYNFYGNSDIEKGMSRAELLSKLKKQKPLCKPGDCYFYTNIVFTLVEEMLKKEKTDLASVLAELRDALGSNEIWIMPIDQSIQVAIPHTKTKEGFKSLGMPPHYSKTAASAAGIFASLSSMIEVYKFLFGYRPDLISLSKLSVMHKGHLTNNDAAKFNPPFAVQDIESYYGLGVRKWRLKGHANKDIIFHSGYIAGVTTFIGFIPSAEIGIVFLANNRSPFLVKSGLDLWSRLVN